MKHYVGKGPYLNRGGLEKVETLGLLAPIEGECEFVAPFWVNYTPNFQS